ncbi:MAG: hypothetical protein ACP5I8_12930 [Phycisphaerae bacterium]
MQPALPHWAAQHEPWQTIARQINRLIDQVNTDSSLMAAEGLNTRRINGAGAVLARQRDNIGYSLVIVQLTAPETGGGKYAGHLFSGNATTVADTKVTMPEGLRDSGNKNALILNLAESNGGAGHRLPTGSFYIGLKAGLTNESPPRLIVLVNAAGPAMFPVGVSKDGGADGTQTAPATWTYTVTSIDGLTTWGTQVPLARPRPNGSMLPQTTAAAFGMAFTDAAGTLRLWDAGEVQNTTACT